MKIGKSTLGYVVCQIRRERQDLRVMGPQLTRVEPSVSFQNTIAPGPCVYPEAGSGPRPASISDATTQMDHNAVVLFTIDRLARSPRATVRTRGTGKAPDP